jgi:ATP-binding cassette subfamily C protein CydC
MKIFLRLLAFLWLPGKSLRGAQRWLLRWQVVLAILLGCVTIASSMGLLGVAAYLIAAAALKPLLIALTLPIYIVRLTSVTRAISRYFERLLAHNVTFRLLASLRTWVHSRLEPLVPAQVLTYRSGDILARLVADVEELQNVYLRVVSPFIVAILISLLTSGLFATFSPVLAWTALAFLTTAGMGVPLLALTLTGGLGRQQLALRAELNAQLVDSIQGMQDMLAYGWADEQHRRITALDRALSRVQRRLAFISGLEQALNDLLMNLALWMMLILAIPPVAAKAIDGVYLAFLALVILASFEAVQPLAPALQYLGHSVAAGKRLFEVTDTPPHVAECAAPLPAPAPLHRWSDEEVCLPTGHTLEFDHVSFVYHSNEGMNEGMVLDGITFTVRSGSRVAIVGPSGAGKSTLIQLACRFWDPTMGVIRLNGQDIRRYALADLRRVIGVVTQDTYIFNDTIRGNLLLARPDASERAIAKALEQAQLAAFIAQLPDGLDTWVGEQGLRLSGGERQRLAIARVLLKDAPLLMLDEVTANLDPLTEHALLETLEGLMQGRTTLIITHRLVAMERMDEILVLDRGRIVERGTHDQLLAASGLYRQMFDVQTGTLVFP